MSIRYGRRMSALFSKSITSSAIGFTEISEAEDLRLKNKWMASDLWPKIVEQATSVEKGSIPTISNFCPEVSYDRFGYFCTYLSGYVDEIDSTTARAGLRKEGASDNDPRWIYGFVAPQHYSECYLYSILDFRGKK